MNVCWTYLLPLPLKNVILIFLNHIKNHHPLSSMGSNDFFGMQNYKFIVSSTEDSIHSSSSCISSESRRSPPPAWQKECYR
jgi:hypothetical protein